MQYLNNIKQQIAIFLSVFIICNVYADDSWKIVPAPPLLSSKAYVLIDADSGDVIVQHKANARKSPASLTKLMTAYIIVNHLQNKKIKANDLVPISVKAWKTEGSRMYAKVNSNVAVLDLLKGIIIQSGNDASVAMAEYIAGSEENFAYLMNLEATRLGMKNSNFVNSMGLHDPNHYSSAYDIALLAQAIIKEDQEYYYLYSQTEFSWNNIKQANRNDLLYQDKSVDGLKTGHTEDAGYCLAASAKRDGKRLIAVVLDARSKNTRTEEAHKLLNYGFNFYDNYTVAKTKQVIGSYSVFKGNINQIDIGIKQDVILTLLKGQDKSLTQEILINKPLIAPIKTGQKLGELVIKSENKELKRIDLVALHTVEQGSLFKRILDSIKLWWQSLFL